MDDIRAAVNSMEQEEQRLLGLRTAAAAAAKENTTLTIGVWMPASLLVLALAALALFASPDLEAPANRRPPAAGNGRLSPAATARR